MPVVRGSFKPVSEIPKVVKAVEEFDHKHHILKSLEDLHDKFDYLVGLLTAQPEDLQEPEDFTAFAPRKKQCLGTDQESTTTEDQSMLIANK